VAVQVASYAMQICAGQHAKPMKTVPQVKSVKEEGA